MATPESDLDRKGIFLHPTADLYGLDRPAETYTQHEPDFEIHEIGKYLRLTLGCNPNLLELLFLPNDCVEYTTDAWEELRGNRDRFLSESAVRSSYGGYAKQQMDRLIRRTEEGKTGFSASITEHRVKKHARHCFRLFWQGKQLLETGEMDVRLDARRRGQLFALGDLPIPEMRQYFDAADAIFQAVPSGLPSEPDRAWVNDWLIDLRMGRVSRRVLFALPGDCLS